MVRATEHDGDMDEATALILTLEQTPTDAPTACSGWTAHELVAHLAAGAAEMADLTEDAVTFAAPGRPDVVLTADRHGPRSSLDAPTAAPAASADPDVRRLALWGRRSSSGPIRWQGPETAGDLGRFRWLEA